jgi:hypothetical protein
MIIFLIFITPLLIIIFRIFEASPCPDGGVCGEDRQFDARYGLGCRGQEAECWCCYSAGMLQFALWDQWVCISGAEIPHYKFNILLEHFEPNAEEIPTGPSCKSLAEAAKTNNVHLIGGSIPERVIENGVAKLYNTSTVWSPEGNMIAKHQKVYQKLYFIFQVVTLYSLCQTHLFDIDIPGKITFKESETLSPGNGLTTFDIGAWKVGLGICYDLRFNEMATIYRKKGNLFCAPKLLLL